MNGLIIDGWNLFSYNGIPNDVKDKKTIAVKYLGDDEIIIYLNKELKFEVFINNSFYFKCDRFSSCLKIADEWLSFKYKE